MLLQSTVLCGCFQFFPVKFFSYFMLIIFIDPVVFVRRFDQLRK